MRNSIFIHNNAGEDYLTSGLFNNKQISKLFNLRCKTVKNAKVNFHYLFKDEFFCPFGPFDSQEHMLKCYKIVSSLNTIKKKKLECVKYEDIFGDPQQQLQVTKVFQTLICIRERLLERDQEPA